MTVIPIDTAQDIADDADAELLTDYSGRGMYGRSCIAFTHCAGRTYDLLFAAIDHLGRDEAQDLFQRARRDNMGVDMVTYFPGVTAGEDVDE